MHAEVTEASVATENVPAGQSVHAEAPIVEYFPPTQSVHEEPASEYMPAKQFTQSAKASDVEGEDLPAGQSVHTEAPIVEYLPTTQLMHAVASVAPVFVRNLPASQSRHMEAPVTILYFPATHAAHDTPLAPMNPMLQRQLVERLVPT